MSVEIRRLNSQSLQTLCFNLAALQNVEAKVGWFESAKYPDGTPVAYAAALNELGHGNTPARPTMRPTAKAQAKEWALAAKQGADAITKGTFSPVQVMEQLAGKAQGDIFKAISVLTLPALSPVTIELRAMKQKNPNLKIGGAVVGYAAWKVKQPGYVAPSGVSTKPLIDSGLMVATLTHIVTK